MAKEREASNSVHLTCVTKKKKDKEPLKKFRSEAERIAMFQRNIQITLTVVVVLLDILLALKAFNVI